MYQVKRIILFCSMLALLTCPCARLASLMPTGTAARPDSVPYTATATPIIASPTALAMDTPSPTPAPTDTPGPAAAPTATYTIIPILPISTPTLTPTLATPTVTPTPTPTPGPLSFYLTACEPSCQEEGARLSVEVLDENGQPLNGVNLAFRANPDDKPAIVASGAQGEGLAELALAAEDDWTIEITDDSGGGLPVVRPPVGDCHSYRLRFQRGVPDPAPVPAPYTPIAFTPIGRRAIPEGEWSPDQMRPLSDWPRPPYDNGLGIHFLPTGYYADWAVDRLIELIHQKQMRWCLVLYNDENMLRLAATKFREAGIMVIWRPDIRPAGGYLYIQRDMDILNEVGMPGYIQLYNEPEVGQEWAEDRTMSIKLFIDHWIGLADQVYQAGGFPGLQVVDPDTVNSLIDEIVAKGKSYLLNEMFFVPHPYGSNHPPSYPYDRNMQSREPGKTVDQDWFCVLGFLKYAHVFQARLGRVPPMICGEGGWTVGIQEDDKYPPISIEKHRDWHVEMFSWFRTARLSNGEPLPDYLFAACPWLIASGGQMQFDQSAWYKSQLSGDKKLTRRALQSMPPFERKFSWE